MAPSGRRSIRSGCYLRSCQSRLVGGIILPVIKGQTLDPDGAKSSSVQNFGGFFTSNVALDSGALGDFLLVYNDTYLDPGGASREVYGHLWGTRLYLPLLER